MTSERLSLRSALELADRFLGQGQAASALDLLLQLQRQARGDDLVQVTRRLVALRMRQGDQRAARADLVYLMQRCCVSLGRPALPGQPRILLLYGLERSAEHLRFHGDPTQLQFSMNAGHFDAVSLLRDPPFGYDRAFLCPANRDLFARSLANANLVVNVVSDPTMEAGTLTLAAEMLSATPRPVVNDPTRVLHTTRDAIARLLADVPGLVVPRAERGPIAAQWLEARRLASGGGLIVRPVTSQTGIDMHRVESGQDLVRALAALPANAGDLFATDFHDFRSPDGFFRKMRAFRIGEQLLPEHRIAFDAWNVHSADRHKFMRENATLRAEEEKFLSDPASVIGASAWNTLHEATRRTGLDYVGIDFAQLPDGRLLLFECNASMRVNFDHVVHFPYMLPHLEALAHAFAALLASRVAKTKAVATLERDGAT